MKKESGAIFQDVEKKYGLAKYKKTEYLKRMLKEFVKYDKKLVKIENYEKMQKEGKVLNEEMLGLISKKKEFLAHLDSLKVALEIYNQSLTVEDEPLAPVSSTDIQKTMSDVEKEMEELMETVSTKLGRFFTVGRVLAEKDRIDIYPLAEMSAAKQSAVSETFKELTTLLREEETTLAHEVQKASQLFNQLLKADNIIPSIEEVINNGDVADVKFTVKKPRENDYETTQAVSILKVEKKGFPDSHPIHELIPETHEDPVHENTAPAKVIQEPEHEHVIEPVTKPEQEPEHMHKEEPIIENAAEKPQEVRQDSCYNKERDDEHEQSQGQQNAEDAENGKNEHENENENDFIWQERKEEEEDFETVVSKTDARKRAKEEEEKSRGFRGNRGYGERRFRNGPRKEPFRKPERKEEKEKPKAEEEKVNKDEVGKVEEGQQEGTHRGRYREQRGHFRGRRRGYQHGGRRNGYVERGDYRPRGRYTEVRNDYY
jgi:hypothetical protein